MLTSVLEGRLLAEKHGTGVPRILALHGWGRTRLDWNQALRGTDALAVDLPGFGVAQPPAEVWGTELYAQQLIPLVRDMDRPLLVGHSFGGRVAARIAAQVPDDVGGLILTGVPLIRVSPRHKPTRMFRLQRRLNQMHVLSDARMARVRHRYGSADYRQASGVMRQILVRVINEDYSEVLKSIAASSYPVRLVWGAEDRDVPLAVAEAIVQQVPRSALTVVPGAAHLLEPLLSERLNQAIVEVESHLTSRVVAHEDNGVKGSDKRDAPLASG